MDSEHEAMGGMFPLDPAKLAEFLQGQKPGEADVELTEAISRLETAVIVRKAMNKNIRALTFAAYSQKRPEWTVPLRRIVDLLAECQYEQVDRERAIREQLERLLRDGGKESP